MQTKAKSWIRKPKVIIAAPTSINEALQQENWKQQREMST